jgi:hypothetical protein
MVAVKEAPPSLWDEHLVPMLDVLELADSVELKVMIPDADHDWTMAALQIDPVEAQLREVVYYDTPDLVLHRHGLVVRVRRIQGARSDSVVKLRPVVPAEVSAKLRRARSFVIEIDALPTGFVCSGSFKGRPGFVDRAELLTGARPVRTLFSKAQWTFLAKHAPAGVDLDTLTLLGPITVHKLKFAPTGHARSLVAELWFYPDGSRILELSTRCEPVDVVAVATETKALLADRGVTLTGEQRTKTRMALEFFSQRVNAASDASADTAAPAGTTERQPRWRALRSRLNSHQGRAGPPSA